LPHFLAAHPRLTRLNPYFRSAMQVRLISSIALVAALVGWVACCLELPTTENRVPIVATQWRRTTAGWEKLSALTARPDAKIQGQSTSTAHPHPAVVSLLTLMLSVAALLAFSPGNCSEINRFPPVPVE
jgi:hypothetical protein